MKQYKNKQLTFTEAKYLSGIIQNTLCILTDINPHQSIMKQILLPTSLFREEHSDNSFKVTQLSGDGIGSNPSHLSLSPGKLKQPSPDGPDSLALRAARSPEMACYGRQLLHFPSLCFLIFKMQVAAPTFLLGGLNELASVRWQRRNKCSFSLSPFYSFPYP